jgi:hypothetical protein
VNVGGNYLETVVSEQRLEGIERYWPLVGISVSVLAAFISVTLLLWLVLLIVDIP